MKVKCTAYRIVDGLLCQAVAKYEIKFSGRHLGYVCGNHKRAYTEKVLFPVSPGVKE
uniref:Uncharacterized protein n=1 Tax=viral metagenome TaxID=1070528 RepID=A0A6M3J7G8_9ZZZZ